MNDLDAAAMPNSTAHEGKMVYQLASIILGAMARHNRAKRNHGFKLEFDRVAYVLDNDPILARDVLTQCRFAPRGDGFWTTYSGVRDLEVPWDECVDVIDLYRPV